VLLSYLTSRAIQHELRHGGLNQEQATNLQYVSDQGKDHPELAGVFRSIDAAIREHEWWRRPRLTLAFIADQTGYSIRDISRAINTQSSDSFSTYINRMRVDAFDQIFNRDSTHASVLDIAITVGFNAKSTFNRVYRQIRSKSPTRH
jgi:transcriptional regulator GlxA family with amidase domain